jgi:transposase-like protein
MRRYSEAVKVDVGRRMCPPHRESVALISEELGFHVVTLYIWRKAWRIQREVPRYQESCPLGLIHPLGGLTDDHEKDLRPRIVCLVQAHIRSIVRGKSRCNAEFGAK